MVKQGRQTNFTAGQYVWLTALKPLKNKSEGKRNVALMDMVKHCQTRIKQHSVLNDLETPLKPSAVPDDVLNLRVRGVLNSNPSEDFEDSYLVISSYMDL